MATGKWYTEWTLVYNHNISGYVIPKSIWVEKQCDQYLLIVLTISTISISLWMACCMSSRIVWFEFIIIRLFIIRTHGRSRKIFCLALDIALKFCKCLGDNAADKNPNRFVQLQMIAKFQRSTIHKTYPREQNLSITHISCLVTHQFCSYDGMPNALWYIFLPWLQFVLRLTACVAKYKLLIGRRCWIICWLIMCDGLEHILNIHLVFNICRFNIFRFSIYYGQRLAIRPITPISLQVWFGQYVKSSFSRLHRFSDYFLYQTDAE